VGTRGIPRRGGYVPRIAPAEPARGGGWGTARDVGSPAAAESHGEEDLLDPGDGQGGQGQRNGGN
jgi:hypothetical protein